MFNFGVMVEELMGNDKNGNPIVVYHYLLPREARQ
jgi:hypothetical protein